jgi:futalosine hydrolase
MSVDLLICVAVELECERIRARLREGRIGAVGVELLVTGVGPARAAHAATLHLARTGARRLVNCGVAGAYPESGLHVLDVACAESDTYGDLGAESPEGFLELPGASNTIRASLFPHERRLPFVTVSTCTGTDARANELAGRTGGAVESMEGAALLEVAEKMGVPAGEIRAISNRVGDRDRASWKLREAAEAAQDALIAWIEGGC